MSSRVGTGVQKSPLLLELVPKALAREVTMQAGAHADEGGGSCRADGSLTDTSAPPPAPTAIVSLFYMLVAT